MVMVPKISRPCGSLSSRQACPAWTARYLPSRNATPLAHSKGLKAVICQVVAITGCTTGTGYVAARTCLRKGAHVAMLNRKSERVDAAVKSLTQEVPGAKITAIECNLADFDSVRSAAAVLNTQFADTGIDVICNNAGVMALADQATKQGYDIQMQTVSSKTSAPICP